MSTSACDSEDLRSINRTVSVSGRYCTNDSTTFGVPIRVLLIVDTSQSMMINDPSGFRGKAASALVAELKSRGQDVSFAFEHFNTGAFPLTTGFTKDAAAIASAMPELNRIEGFTNYLGAVQLARTIVTEDIAKTSTELKVLEMQGMNVRYLRPWYFVVFLSDGIPRMPGGVLQSTESILAELELLMTVPKDVSGITFHTAFLGAADDALRPDAEALLGKMAQVGRGNYFSFTRGDQIDFKVFDFQIKRLFDLKQLVVYNRSTALPDDAEVPLADSDQDGLADDDEVKLGTDALNPDTDGDGMGDGYERVAQLDPLKPNTGCTADMLADTDKDGLNDCEEDFKSFSKERFDSDVDLFPDRLELLSGSNPVDPIDVETDLDFDGVLLGDELRTRTKVLVEDKLEQPRYAFRYHLTRKLDQGTGASCFDYKVQNIGVVRTQEYGGRAAGINELVLDVIEVPQDRPDNEFSLNRLVLPVAFDEYQLEAAIPSGTKFETLGTMEVKDAPR